MWEARFEAPLAGRFMAAQFWGTVAFDSASSMALESLGMIFRVSFVVCSAYHSLDFADVHSKKTFTFDWETRGKYFQSENVYCHIVRISCDLPRAFSVRRQ